MSPVSFAIASTHVHAKQTVCRLAPKDSEDKLFHLDFRLTHLMENKVYFLTVPMECNIAH